MSPTDVHNAKNSAVWKNTQYVDISIMAPQNENNIKTQLTICEINDLRAHLGLVLAKFWGAVLNMG